MLGKPTSLPAVLGSARASRAGDGAPPSRTFIALLPPNQHTAAQPAEVTVCDRRAGAFHRNAATSEIPHQRGPDPRQRRRRIERLDGANLPARDLVAPRQERRAAEERDLLRGFLLRGGVADAAKRGAGLSSSCHLTLAENPATTRRHLQPLAEPGSKSAIQSTP